VSVLLGVIALFAILALALAIWEAVAIVKLSPKGSTLRSSFWLGWWKFGQIEAQAGPDATQHLAIYKRATIAFVVFIVLGLILSGWSVNNGGTSEAAQSALINDPRVIPAQFAYQFTIPARLEAQMPESAWQES
jgi:hypothetical protein